LGGALLRQLEILAGAIGCFQAIGNLSGALVHHGTDGTPYECVAEPHEEKERDGLAN
jgi:hypothetical protein